MENPCSKSEIDVFRPIDVQVALTDGFWHTYYPLQSLTNASSTIEFTIPATSNEVIDMTSISLYLGGKICKGADGTTALVEANALCPANNFFHSLIRHIDVTINGQLVTRTSRDYAYKAMFMKLAQVDMPRGGRKDAQLALEGFAMDSPGCNKTLVGNDANKGLVERRKLIKNSAFFELRGNLCVDLFQCERSLAAGSDITIKIYLNEPKFYLIDATAAGANRVADPKLNLMNAELYVRRVTLAPSYVNAMVQEVKQRPEIYPFTRREMVTISLPLGITSIDKENLFQGKVATRFFFAMVKATDYTGVITSNPYKFRHHHLAEVCLMENSNPMSQRPLKLDFQAATSKTVNAYHLFLECIGGIGDRALATPVTKDHWKDGTTIFAYTRSPDLSHGINHLPPQQANLTLHLSFAQALPHAAIMICMAEFDSVMMIDEDNQITTDFSL